MEIGSLVFTLEGWQAILALFGPLLVGGLTGLTTSSKAKAIIAMVIIVATVAVQAVLQGGWTSDVFANILAVAAIWQSMFLFWQALGLTKFLQTSVPIQLFTK